MFEMNDFCKTLIVCFVVIQTVILAIIADTSQKVYESITPKPVIHIDRLVVDTIHSEDIEIFPLCDLDGNIVYENN